LGLVFKGKNVFNMVKDVRIPLGLHYLLKTVATSITGPNSQNFNFGFFFFGKKMGTTAARTDCDRNRMSVFIVVPCCMLFQSLLYCSNSCTSLHFKTLKSYTKILKISPYILRSPLKPSSGGPWPYFAVTQLEC
jgi:hypothetical protein